MAGEARQFAIQLDREFAERVEGRLREAVQKIGMETLRRVVLKTPVDTGRARGNWFVTLDAPTTETTAAVDPSGAATIGRGARVIGGMRDVRAIWLTNSLPYIQRLESGYSKQAPAGMVAVTVAEINAALGRIQ